MRERQSNNTSTCPLDIVASKGKLIPTINKAEGLISSNFFFIVKKMINEPLNKDIKLNKFFDNS